MSKGFASNYRIVLLSGALLLCFGGIGARLVWLHVVYRDELVETKVDPRRDLNAQPRLQPRRQLIAETRRQLIVDKSRRGDIYDARGAVLATSRSVLQLGVDPNPLSEKDEKLQQDRFKKDPKQRVKYEAQRRREEQEGWPKLAALIGMPEFELRRIMTTKFRPTSSENAAANANAARSAGTAARSGLVFNVTLPSASNSPSAAPVAEPAAVATDLDDESSAKSAAPRFTLSDSGADAAEDDDDGETELTDDGRRKIRWAVLVPEISEAANDQVKALCAQYGIKNVYATSSYRRVYPHNQLGAHVVGFVNRSEQAVAGIERFADFYLKGQDGWREGERDVRGRELPQFNKRSVERVDGYGVTLSLQTKVQNIVERELAALAAQYRPVKATIIVSDPRDGFILGLANYPSFNPNEYNKVPTSELARLKNIAVADVYEPGSVFKIVAAAAALDQGLVTADSRFDCSTTKIEYRGKMRALPSEDHRFDHPLTVAEIVSRSSNRGAAQLAMKLGDERYYDYVRAFGFGQRTGFPGGHEAPGILSAPKRWDGLTITRMPMGHSVAVTVLQMHQAMTVIASGGVLLEPQIVQTVRDTAGTPVYRFARNETRRVISERTAQTVAQLLAGCVLVGGTATEAAIPGYDVAGKTGTTQKYLPEVMPSGKIKLIPSNKHHVASFVGFFPASRPQVVISVIVDDADAASPGGVAYGGKVAAPAFRRIGEQLIPILDIKTGLTARSVPLFNPVALQ